MTKETKSGLIVFAVLIVVAVGVAVASIFAPESTAAEKSISNAKSGKNSQIVLDKEYDKEIVKSFKDEYVAALYITGVIQQENQDYDQKWLLSTIKQLKSDSKNQGIVIFMDTPGGAVYQSDEAYLALQDYRTSGKKIFVYMASMAASGGYYISCAANEIWANRNTLTGSIGVISGQILDASELLEKTGIKTEIIHSGKNKVMGHMSEKFTDEQRQIMQSISDECYQQFTDIVAKGRNIPIETVYKLADGRPYTAKQALESKLIDRIDSWENCLSYFTETIIEKPGIRIETFQKERKQSFKSYLTGTLSDVFKNQAAAKLGIPVKVLNELESFNDYPAYIYIN